MSMTIEKLDGGYIVMHHNTRQVATAEHVARLIVKFWPEVTAHIRAQLHEPEPEVPTVK